MATPRAAAAGGTTPSSERFAQVLFFVAQAGYERDVVQAGAACRASYEGERLYSRLVRLRTYFGTYHYRYPEHPATALHAAAAASGDGARVRWLLERCGADVEGNPERFAKVYTPLHAACAHARVGAARALMDAGADLRAATYEGHSTLHLALRAGSIVPERHLRAPGGQLALELMSRGAPLTGVDRHGYTPLHCAALNGHVAVIHALVSVGVPVNSVSDRPGGGGNASGWGTTALYCALTAAEPDAALALLERGADARAVVPHCSWSCLHAAAHRGVTSLVDELLRRGADINGRQNQGYTPLHMALSERRLETAALLVARGADVHARDSLGFTPLVLGCKRTAVGCARMLVAAGADPNTADQYGHTTMYLAFTTDDSKQAQAMVVDLVQAGANPNISPPTAGSYMGDFHPLAMAAAHGWRDAVRALLAAGADVNYRAAGGSLALRVALSSPSPVNEGIAIDLLKAGADPPAPGDDGRSPLELACANRLARAAEALLEAGAGT